MSTERERCAANNVAWYETVLRPHGIRGSVDDGIWTWRGGVPPYYSNAIVFSPTPVGVQVAAIRDLAAELDRAFTVKDGFAHLDLAASGFRVLFDAEWVWRDPASANRPTGAGGPEWRPVATAAELERWEAAWRASDSPADARVFLPGLLADPEVRIVGGHSGDRIVAGCAANRSGDVVGFSNYFAIDPDDEAMLVAAVAEVARFAPGLPIVGYEWGAALDRTLRIGFRAVGPLRVWIHAPPEAAGS